MNLIFLVFSPAKTNISDPVECLSSAIQLPPSGTLYSQHQKKKSNISTTPACQDSFISNTINTNSNAKSIYR